MALIELDLDTLAEPVASAPPPGRHRPLSAAFVALLVLMLAGSAQPRSTLWRFTGMATIADPQGTYELVGGQLYTFEADTTRLVTVAWGLDPLRRLWDRATVIPPQRRNGGLPGLGWYVRPAAPGDVLLQAEATATVLEARTGRVRWSSPVPVDPIDGGRIGLVHDQRFRPGTTYNERIGAAGPLYFGVDGRFHTEPPAITTLRALDLRTGRQLWTAELPGSLVTAAAPGNPGAILAVGSERLTLLSGTTGAVLRERALTGVPSGDGRIIGDVVLLQQGGSRGSGEQVAYSARTFDRLWSLPVTGENGPAYCSELLCTGGLGGMSVLDPATGRPRWRTTLGSSLQGRGGVTVELGDAATRPVALRNAATGAVLVDVREWTWFADSAPDDPLVLGRVDGRQMVFGVVLPGRRTVQLLGVSPTPVANCASDERFVVCRMIDGVEVWAYLS